MDDLFIKNSPYVKIRQGLGIFMILTSIVWIFIYIGSLKIFDIINSFFWLFGGTYNLTNGFGTEKSYCMVGSNNLKIKWMNRFTPVIIPDSEIENITLTRTSIVIYRSATKPVKLKIDILELNQKRDIYNFFIEYSDIRKLTLVRKF